MSPNTEGAIVQASNAAQDLTAMVVTYLEAVKRISGERWVVVPRVSYSVVFEPMKKEGWLFTRLIYTDHHTRQVATHYSSDSDYFSESMGANNVSGYKVEGWSSNEDRGFQIPISHLLLGKEAREALLQDMVKKHDTKLAEEARQRKISQLETELTKLKGPQT